MKLAFAWLVTLAVAFYIVFLAKIGPVVLTLSKTHGVHSGDFIAVALVAALGLYTLARLAANRRR